MKTLVYEFEYSDIEEVILTTGKMVVFKFKNGDRMTFFNGKALRIYKHYCKQSTDDHI
jgi:hypothetical protein